MLLNLYSNYFEPQQLLKAFYDPSFMSLTPVVIAKINTVTKHFHAKENFLFDDKKKTKRKSNPKITKIIIIFI